MEKSAAKFAFFVVLALLASPVPAVQAQTDLSPAGMLITAAPLTAEAPPAEEPVPIDITAGTRQPGAVTAGSADSTVPADSTGAADATGASSADSSARDIDDEEEIYYPDAEIPVLDLDSGEQTQETSTGLIPTEKAPCLTAQDAESAILPAVTGNQVKISLLVFLGAAMGSLLYFLAAFLLNSSAGRREELRAARQSKLRIRARKDKILAGAHANLSRILPGLFSESKGRMSLDPKNLAEYRAAAPVVEIFGSSKSLEAHKKLLSLISGPKAPAPEEFEAAKSGLLSSLQKDISAP